MKPKNVYWIVRDNTLGGYIYLAHGNVWTTHKEFVKKFTTKDEAIKAHKRCPESYVVRVTKYSSLESKIKAWEPVIRAAIAYTNDGRASTFEYLCAAVTNLPTKYRP